MYSIPTKQSTYNCKVVLLGDIAVGKSSLVLRFVKNTFFENHAQTIGAAFLIKHVAIHDHTIKFEIWDTAGQERFHSLAPMYYRGAQAAIVVYDITKPESFSRAVAWVNELYVQASSDIVVMLAGNKVDLTDMRMVQYNQAATFAKERNLLFLEASAKTEQNVEELFYEIAKNCLNKFDSPQQHNNINIDKELEGKKCCNSS